ncbi:hypothetical protein HK102_007885 [Quaeritorhiza haematococci]|nr:hypothetical protein HK102_007885 [Quaeritorhiza haematococci]
MGDGPNRPTELLRECLKTLERTSHNREQYLLEANEATAHVTSAMRELHDFLASKEADFASLMSRIKTLESANTTLQKDKEELNRKLKSATNRIESLARDTASLKAQLKAAKDQAGKAVKVPVGTVGGGGVAGAKGNQHAGENNFDDVDMMEEIVEEGSIGFAMPHPPPSSLNHAAPAAANDTPPAPPPTPPPDLIAWTKVFKDNYPAGTLSCLRVAAKERIAEAVTEFLVLKLDPQIAAVCTVTVKEKSIPAIPKALIDEFVQWFNKQIDDGLLEESQPRKRRASDLPAVPEVKEIKEVKEAGKRRGRPHSSTSKRARYSTGTADFGVQQTPTPERSVAITSAASTTHSRVNGSVATTGGRGAVGATPRRNSMDMGKTNAKSGPKPVDTARQEVTNGTTNAARPSSAETGKQEVKGGTTNAPRPSSADTGKQDVNGGTTTAPRQTTSSTSSSATSTSAPSKSASVPLTAANVLSQYPVQNPPKVTKTSSAPATTLTSTTAAPAASTTTTDAPRIKSPVSEKASQAQKPPLAPKSRSQSPVKQAAQQTNGAESTRSDDARAQQRQSASAPPVSASAVSRTQPQSQQHKQPSPAPGVQPSSQPAREVPQQQQPEKQQQPPPATQPQTETRLNEAQVRPNVPSSALSSEKVSSPSKATFDRSKLIRFIGFITAILPDFQSYPVEEKKEIRRLVRKQVQERLPRSVFDQCLMANTDGKRTFGIPIEMDKGLKEWARDTFREKYPEYRVV